MCLILISIWVFRVNLNGQVKNCKSFFVPLKVTKRTSFNIISIHIFGVIMNCFLALHQSFLVSLEIAKHISFSSLSMSNIMTTGIGLLHLNFDSLIIGCKGFRISLQVAKSFSFVAKSTTD